MSPDPAGDRANTEPHAVSEVGQARLAAWIDIDRQAGDKAATYTADYNGRLVDAADCLVDAADCLVDAATASPAKYSRYAAVG